MAIVRAALRRHLGVCSQIALVSVCSCNGSFNFNEDDPVTIDAALSQSRDAEPEVGPLPSEDASLVADARDASEEAPEEEPDAPTDAEMGDSAKRIACGDETCVFPSQRCCALESGSRCVAESESCGGLRIPCDDPTDCPRGQICCSEPHRSHIQSNECETASNCLLNDDIILCKPGAPDVCPQCVPITTPPLPPGYFQCLQP